MTRQKKLSIGAFRYPGRLLQPGEVIPEAMLAFVGAQIGLSGEALAGYGERGATRYQHSVALQQLYGYRPPSQVEALHACDVAVRGFSLSRLGARTSALGLTAISSVCGMRRYRQQAQQAQAEVDRLFPSTGLPDGHSPPPRHRSGPGGSDSRPDARPPTGSSSPACRG